ncbi:hypothetical protein BKA81DRAFT_402100, partial [Phyllosticta paracitricarpa]
MADRKPRDAPMRWNLRPRGANGRVEKQQTTSTAGSDETLTYRGKRGDEILQGERMRWTERDLRTIRIFAARYQWPLNSSCIPEKQLQELQQDLGVYTNSARLNQIIMWKLRGAIQYDLCERVGKTDDKWPRSSSRWFLDPCWQKLPTT